MRTRSQRPLNLSLPLALTFPLAPARVKNTILTHVRVLVRCKFSVSLPSLPRRVHCTRDLKPGGGEEPGKEESNAEKEEMPRGEKVRRDRTFYRELCASSVLRSDSKIYK